MNEFIFDQLDQFKDDWKQEILLFGLDYWNKTKKLDDIKKQEIITLKDSVQIDQGLEIPILQREYILEPNIDTEEIDKFYFNLNIYHYQKIVKCILLNITQINIIQQYSFLRYFICNNYLFLLDYILFIHWQYKHLRGKIVMELDVSFKIIQSLEDCTLIEQNYVIIFEDVLQIIKKLKIYIIFFIQGFKGLEIYDQQNFFIKQFKLVFHFTQSRQMAQNNDEMKQQFDNIHDK
ncbi:unnamed protein product (macronuclear) [Paramecium tetraurelia]|uniref:Uncharacterized protein n=1 Tax=Paramecium tetraurelia TaxID=5888 RepID=A0C8C0_PARTE|nr:uncharacterized protein GSPATT00036170001 [Paramecium tetraurelia]CAK67037.1 unnamed protein product [Paramecium tetraurelia]|eukprot:XP_001434434.1 hypothetical protein (macronuclear) [Paramecium tetraurelia strain d4-2]